MANTTTSAICASIKTTLEALDPAGDDCGLRSGFLQSPDGRTNKKLALSDMDREFRIGMILPTTAGVMFGDTAEIEFDGIMPLTIWHRRTGKMSEARDRMTKDIAQIIQNLEKKTGANYPTGVSLIRLKGAPTVKELKDDQGWETTMNFRIRYAQADV